MKIRWDKRFKRTYRKKISKSQNLKQKFWDAITLFSQYPFDKKLRTHKLSGELARCWAFSISYDLRIVFEFIDNDTVLLIDIGTHGDVY